MKAKIAIFLTSLLLTLPSGLFAQTITLDKIELDNKQISSSMSGNIYPKASSDDDNWVKFMAHYDVKFGNVKPKGLLDNGKWLDDVEVTWEMLYSPLGKNAKSIKQFIKTEKKIKYRNVTEGKNTSVVFIDPRTLKRYFNEGKSSFMRGLMLRFTMKIGGKTVRNMTSYIVDAKEDKKQEFKSAFDSEDSHELKNVLLNRNETPFKFSQVGYFDLIVEDDK
ncbi:MAG: hypothetical protein MK132_04475 [Lentisphaerales bacterium]|nr:hypothetical protein [Lentisphaerales bacterium]